MAEYHELVFEGPLAEVKAFLTGLRVGKGWVTPFICSEEADVRGETLRHKALEKIKLTKELSYVLVIDRQVTPITEAAAAAKKSLGLAVHRDRVVREANFAYRFRVFNKSIGARLHKLLENPPADLVRTPSEEAEDVHPGAAGIEVYTPEHDYVFKGAGTVRGPLPAVLAYRDELRRIEQVEVEKVSLALR